MDQVGEEDLLRAEEEVGDRPWVEEEAEVLP